MKVQSDLIDQGWTEKVSSFVPSLDISDTKPYIKIHPDHIHLTFIFKIVVMLITHLNKSQVRYFRFNQTFSIHYFLKLHLKCFGLWDDDMKDAQLTLLKLIVI